MPKENLREKIKNLFFWTIVFSLLYFIIAFLLESSWLKDSVSPPEIYELLKDDLTITAALLAPVAALLLFSDWKEQHVLTLVDSAARKISEDLQDLYILTLQAHQMDPLEVTDKYIKLYEHPVKGSLFSIRRSIEINEKIIKNSGIKCHSLLANMYLLMAISEDLEQNIQICKECYYHLEETEKLGTSSIHDIDRQQLNGRIRSLSTIFNKDYKEMRELILEIEKQLEEMQI